MTAHPGGGPAAAEESAGMLSRSVFLWARPFLRDAAASVAREAFVLASLPAAPAREDPAPSISAFDALVADEMSRKTPSINRVFWRMWRRDFWPQAAVCFVISLLTAVSPLLLRQSILAMRGHAPAATGYLSVFGMAFIGICTGILQQHNFHVASRLGRLSWVAIVGSVFKKPATLDHANFARVFSEGEVLSLIGQDASMFPYMAPFAGIFMATPFNILFPTIVLLVFFREALMAGLVLCAVVMLISNKASQTYKRCVAAKLRCADERLVLMNESLQGIRSVKLCVWEAAIESRVRAIRERELEALLRAHLFYALQQGLVAGVPVLVAAATFLTHAALGRAIEPDLVFMALASFDQLSIGMLILPNIHLQVKTFALALARAGRLVLRQDTYRSPVELGAPAGISIVDGTFGWNPAAERADLSGVTLSVRPGELVAVVGRVASGKSTLACAILGLVPCLGGKLSVGGRCAFVPQSPQILNASVRDNILFGEPYREDRYLEAVRCCALEQDIAQFVDGDLTEIGEKGISISGGQRARVALARAFYADPDVVVMDDPLSAMDPHVGGAVFQGCVLGLRRAGKAVLLMTNQVYLCEAADGVCVLDAGQLLRHSARGPPPEGGLGGPGSGPPGGAREAALAAVPGRAAGLGGEAPAGLPPGGQKSSGMAEEGVAQGRISLREFLRLAAVGRSLGLGCVVVALCLLAPALMYATNVLLGIWAYAVVGQDPSGSTAELGMYMAAGCLYIACQGIRVTTAALYFTRLSRQLHEQMLAAALRQTMAWYDTTPLGRILNRFSQDVSLLDLQLPRLFEFTMQHFGAVMVGLLGSCVLIWPSIVVVVPLLLFLRRIFRQYGSVSLHLQRIMLVSTSPVMSKTSSFLTALNTIRAFGKEDFFFRDFVAAMADFNRTYYWIHSLDRYMQSLLVVVCIPVLTLALGLGMLAFGRAGVFAADLSALAMALVPGLSMRIPLWLWCSATTEKFFGGVQRAGEYAELPWEGAAVDRAAWLGAREGAAEAPAPVAGAAALQLEDVHARYQPGLPLVLRGLSLRVEAGQRLGVCGRTGSGKSTLFLACFRMVAVERGRVLVGGVDAAGMPLPLLRASLAVVPQDTLMFSGTVRSNLDFYGRHSDAELWEVLRQVRLDVQVRSLTDALGAPVQEKGSNFSAGTVQLLCIARVLLGRQRAVFLDECTASVDYETDALVQASVREVMAGRAVVCIAHRLHTIIDYDRVACLEAGRVVEHGPPRELAARPGGAFARLVDSTGAASAAELRRQAPSATGSAASRGVGSADPVRRAGVLSFRSPLRVPCCPAR